VLARRAVDRARSARRLEPLPEPDTPHEPSVPPLPLDVDRAQRLAMVRTALAAAVHRHAIGSAWLSTIRGN
jgi:hypothetical protein